MILHEMGCGKYYIKTEDRDIIEIISLKTEPILLDEYKLSCSYNIPIEYIEGRILPNYDKKNNIKGVYSKVCPEFDIEDVIYNGPATIVKWKDGTKTVVKCENEDFDKEKGLAMCFAKKAMGNKGHYYETFKEWCPEEEEKEEDFVWPAMPVSLFSDVKKDINKTLKDMVKAYNLSNSNKKEKHCFNCNHRKEKRKQGGPCRACISAELPDGRYSTPSHWEEIAQCCSNCKYWLGFGKHIEYPCTECIQKVDLNDIRRYISTKFEPKEEYDK